MGSRVSALRSSKMRAHRVFSVKSDFPQDRSFVPAPSQAHTRAPTSQPSVAWPGCGCMSGQEQWTQTHLSPLRLCSHKSRKQRTQYLPSFSSRFCSYTGVHPPLHLLQVCVHKQRVQADPSAQQTPAPSRGRQPLSNIPRALLYLHHPKSFSGALSGHGWHWSCATPSHGPMAGFL